MNKLQFVNCLWLGKAWRGFRQRIEKHIPDRKAALVPNQEPLLQSSKALELPKEKVT